MRASAANSGADPDPIYGFARRFLNRAQALECQMTLSLSEGADHGDYNDYLLVYQETPGRMVAFLEAHGYLA